MMKKRLIPLICFGLIMSSIVFPSNKAYAYENQHWKYLKGQVRYYEQDKEDFKEICSLHEKNPLNLRNIYAHYTINVYRDLTKIANENMKTYYNGNALVGLLDIKNNKIYLKKGDTLEDTYYKIASSLVYHYSLDKFKKELNNAAKENDVLLEDFLYETFDMFINEKDNLISTYPEIYDLYNDKLNIYEEVEVKKEEPIIEEKQEQKQEIKEEIKQEIKNEVPKKKITLNTENREIEISSEESKGINEVKRISIKEGINEIITIYYSDDSIETIKKERDIIDLIESTYFDKLYSDGDLYFEDSSNTLAYIKVLNTISRYIPYNVLKDFVERPTWDLRFVIEVPGNPNYAGLIKYYQETIYVENMATSSMEFTLMHEFGHYVDYNSRIEGVRTTSSNYFKEIYNKYKDIYPCRDYAKSSAEEFFADLFVDYTMNSYKIIQYQELKDIMELAISQIN